MLGCAAIALMAGCSSAAHPSAGAQRHSASDPSPTVSGTFVPTSTPSEPGFDKTAHSIDDPTSIWVVVNKARPLSPLNYAPAELAFAPVAYVNRQPMRPEAATALATMLQAGKTEAGLDFSVQSGYRSFASQTGVYDDDKAQHGQAYADTDTARPGHSEHQTGLAVDISAVPAKCSLAACFADTPQGKWLAANAWRFGFLLRYPADKVAVTGFTFEPWHFRYIGVPLATELHKTKVTTLEEFFGVHGGTGYPTAVG